MKRLICLLLALAAVSAPVQAAVWTENSPLSAVLSVYTSEETGGEEIADDAAKHAYEVLNFAGLIPAMTMASDLGKGLGRLELCNMIVPVYKLLSGTEEIETVRVPYDDCTESAAAEAYTLGLIATTAAGTFDATGHITREEAVTAIIGMLERSGIDCALGEEELSAVCGYDDFADASGWAYNALAKAVSEGFVCGNAGKLRPKDDITRIEMICAVAAVWEKYMPDAQKYALPQVTAPSEGAEESGDFRVSWDATDAESYSVIVKDSTRECAILLDTRACSVYADTGCFVDGEEYKIIVAANYEGGFCTYSAPVSVTYKKPKTISKMTVEEKIAKRARAFGGGNQFATAEEASANMRSVTVPVWRLAADGTKYESTAALTVNKYLADDIVAIFTEIFEDSSRFPIKDIGCYNWRNTAGGAQSQHSFGTCIDINSNENYYISAAGHVISGRLWQPYENPYSITPDGIVVKTFAKYGWLWGGDAWGEGYAKDYMHMTYLGG